MDKDTADDIASVIVGKWSESRFNKIVAAAKAKYKKRQAPAG